MTKRGETTAYNKCEYPGGLIEDNSSRTVQKVPFLGDLPLIGALFRDTGVSTSRNELVVTVTPHVIRGVAGVPKSTAAASRTAPSGLPTLPPTLPLPSAPMPAPLPTTPAEAPQTLVPTQQASPSSSPSAIPSSLASPPAAALRGLTNGDGIYEFGNPNTPSAPTTPGPSIFYARVDPIRAHPSDVITISLLTSTDVVSAKIGVPGAPLSGTLGALGNGNWRGSLAVTGDAAPGTVPTNIVVVDSSGKQATISIPLVILAR